MRNKLSIAVQMGLLISYVFIESSIFCQQFPFFSSKVVSFLLVSKLHLRVWTTVLGKEDLYSTNMLLLRDNLRMIYNQSRFATVSFLRAI